MPAFLLGWDFATIAMLEHSYRLQGIAKGWLQPNEYVRFSEQAYGQFLSLRSSTQIVCGLWHQ